MECIKVKQIYIKAPLKTATAKIATGYIASERPGTRNITLYRLLVYYFIRL